MSSHVATTTCDDAAAIDDELEMVLQMYSDECERLVGSSSSNNNDDMTATRGLVVHLPHRLDVCVTLPRHGYPHMAFPDVCIHNNNTNDNDDEDNSDADKARRRAFVAAVQQRMREELCLGYPVLLPLIALAHTLADDYAADDDGVAAATTHHDDDNNDDDNDNDKEAAASTLYLDDHNDDDDDTSAIEVWSSEAIVDRKSKFVAHLARVHTHADVHAVVAHVRARRHIATATHPAIYAYRFTDDKGVLHKDCDDDGEHGASAKLVFLLDQLRVDGYVVVVTRWFGGILLGPDRFKHIMEVARRVLLTIPQRDDARGGSARSGAATATRAKSSASSSQPAKASRRRR